MGEIFSSVVEKPMVRRASLEIIGAGGVMSVGIMTQGAAAAVCNPVHIVYPMSPSAMVAGKVVAVAHTGGAAALTSTPATIANFLHTTEELQSVVRVVAAGHIPPGMYQGVRLVGDPSAHIEVISRTTSLIEQRTAIVLDSALQVPNPSVELQRSIDRLRSRLQTVRREVERVHHTALDCRMELLEHLDPTFCREESLAWQGERAQRRFEEIMCFFEHQ